MSISMTFTEATVPDVGTIGGIAYGNGIYLAVSASWIPLTSPDGITWTQQPAIFGTPDTCSDVIFDGEKFLVAGGTGTGAGTQRNATSVDGITWSVLYSRDAGYSNFLAFNGVDHYLGVSLRTDVVESADGLAWVQLPSLPSGGRDIAYGAGVYVVAGSSNTLKWSDDNGLTWNNGTGDVGIGGLDVGLTYDGSRFICASGSSAFISTDGKAWAEISTTNSSGNLSVTAVGGTIVIGSNNGGEITASNDGGQTWFAQTNPITAEWQSATGVLGGKFVLAGDSIGVSKIITAAAPANSLDIGDEELQEATSYLSDTGGTNKAVFKAYDSTLGASGGWESNDAANATPTAADTTSGFDVFLDFNDGNLTLWEGLSEIGYVKGTLAIDCANDGRTELPGALRAITSGSVEVTDGSSNVATKTGLPISDLFFESSDSGVASTYTLPFSIDFTGSGLTSVPSSIKFSLSAGTGNVLDVLRVRVSDLALNDDETEPPDPDLPGDDAEEIEVSYGELGGSDPKVVPLQLKDDVQTNANTMKKNLADFKNEWSIEKIIGQGERSQYTTIDSSGNLQFFKVTHDSPGLREGRIGVLVGFSARSALSNVPVTLTFRGL